MAEVNLFAGSIQPLMEMSGRRSFWNRKYLGLSLEPFPRLFFRSFLGIVTASEVIGHVQDVPVGQLKHLERLALRHGGDCVGIRGKRERGSEAG